MKETLGNRIKITRRNFLKGVGIATTGIATAQAVSLTVMGYLSSEPASGENERVIFAGNQPFPNEPFERDFCCDVVDGVRCYYDGSAWKKIF